MAFWEIDITTMDNFTGENKVVGREAGGVHQTGPPKRPSPDAQLMHPIATSGEMRCCPARLVRGTRQWEVVPKLWLPCKHVHTVFSAWDFRVQNLEQNSEATCWCKTSCIHMYRNVSQLSYVSERVMMQSTTPTIYTIESTLHKS